MKKLVLVSLKTFCLFCRLGYMCLNFAYNQYTKSGGSLEILGRIDSIIVSYWFYNYFQLLSIALCRKC